MQRNGKAPQAVGTTLQGVASTLQGVASTSQGVASTSQGVDGTLQGVDGTLQGVAGTSQGAAQPGWHRIGAYRARDGVAQRLAAAQLAIESVLADPALRDALAARGYDTARILEGRALVDQALALTQQQRARVGERFAATDARASAQAVAHIDYMRHVRVARVALRDDRGAAQALDLGARKRKQAGWLLQARQFYANALAGATIVDRLAVYGVTREQLIAARDRVEAVGASAVAQQSRKGVAQETIRARNVALAALNRWMRDFLEIARLALEQ